MSDIKTEAVLITGAAKRIGKAIALSMAQAGWRIAVHYHKSSSEAEDTVKAIRDAGGTAEALGADLADPDAVGKLIGHSIDRLGPVTCLINNASVFEADEAMSMTAESWATHFDVNLRAPVFLAQAFAHNLAPDASGAIINLLDQRVWRLTPKFLSYTLSKSALWTATRTLAQALAPAIRVNAIGPGPALANVRQSAADFAAQRKATLLGRGPSPEEIGHAVRFILDSPAMTGQMIVLDGGQHLAWQTPDVLVAEE